MAAAAAMRRTRDAASLAFRSERARFASSVLARRTRLPPLGAAVPLLGMVVEMTVMARVMRVVGVVVLVTVVVVAALLVVVVMTVLVVVPAEGVSSIE